MNGEQPTPATLTVRGSLNFEKYQKRRGTKKEIAYFKKSEKFYRDHKPV